MSNCYLVICGLSPLALMYHLLMNSNVKKIPIYLPIRLRPKYQQSLLLQVICSDRHNTYSLFSPSKLLPPSSLQLSFFLLPLEPDSQPKDLILKIVLERKQNSHLLHHPQTPK